MFVLILIKIISILAAIIGFFFLIPLGVALYYHESSVYFAFLIPMAISFVIAIIINLLTRKKKIVLTIRQTYVMVALAWIFSSLMSSLPLFFSGCFNSYVDAFFESVSGFSTTGVTILSAVENLPRSINLWRCITHWLGGMGIVTLTVALLPLLGVGGFQLIKAETTGPEKSKVTARITTTAKVLWGLYIGFTVIQTIALKIAGMDFVDAMSHAFSTLGTGGFSTRNDSIGSYNSVAIEVICTIFMFIAGINFSLFFFMITGKFKEVLKNSEFKTYISFIVIFILGITFSLLKTYGSFGTSLRKASFQVISLMTTTGYSTADYLQWPYVSQFFLFLLFFIGGCSGSTSGGIKVIRWTILGKVFKNETKKMIHPHGVFSLRIDGKPVTNELINNVVSFFFLYAVLVVVTTFAGCIAHLDLWTAFTSALSMIGNVGPAFGKCGPTANMGFLPSYLKLIYCFAMIAGRLELYTILIFFTSSFWKNK